jgi:hypothetical protein
VLTSSIFSDKLVPFVAMLAVFRCDTKSKLKERGVAKTEKNELIQGLIAVSERINLLQTQLETLQQEMLMLKKTAHSPLQNASGLAYADPRQRMAYLQKQSDELLKDYAEAMASLRHVVAGNELMMREEAHAPELAVMGRLM